MNFLIITHAFHTRENERYYAYAPYIKEMNLWLKHVDKVTIVAPLNIKGKKGAIDIPYLHEDINFISVPAFNLLNVKSVLNSLFLIPFLFFKTIMAMKRADHIHLRCPGNMGLIGCIAQIFYPRKTKTVKYAGNWDSNSKQPLSYRWQRSILKNTFFTRNAQVLVYGQWPHQSKNIKSFFTASYNESDKVVIEKKLGNTLDFLFVGTITANKQPESLLKLVNRLNEIGIKAQAHFYGDGLLKKQLEKQFPDANFYGNQPATVVQEHYKKAHFLVLNSQSEGWPKVVAEAMWYGCVPIASRVSCVPWMLGISDDEEIRGVLFNDMNKVVEHIIDLIKDKDSYGKMSVNAQQWAQQYTLEKFEKEIKKLLQ